MSGGFDQRSEVVRVFWDVDEHWRIFKNFIFKVFFVLLMPTVTVASNLIFPPPNIGWQSWGLFFYFFLASL